MEIPATETRSFSSGMGVPTYIKMGKESWVDRKKKALPPLVLVALGFGGFL